MYKESNLLLHGVVGSFFFNIFGDLTLMWLWNGFDLTSTWFDKIYYINFIH